MSTESGSAASATGSSRRCTVTVSPTGRGFRGYPLLGASPKKQQTSLRASLLNGSAHERVDQFFENDFAGDGLRHLDHGREVELFDGRPNRAGWDRGGAPGLSGMDTLVELPHLGVGAPTQIAVAGVPADTGGRSLRGRGPRRSGRRARRPAPHGERSRWRAPSGWPVRRDARRRVSRPSRRAISAPTSAARFSKFSGQLSA